MDLLLVWFFYPPQQRVVFGIFFIFILDWLLSLDFIHSNSDSAGPNLEISKMESGRRAYGFWPKTPGWMSPCDADNGSTDVSDLMARQ